jgi:hypothetical protein
LNISLLLAVVVVETVLAVVAVVEQAGSERHQGLLFLLVQQLQLPWEAAVTAVHLLREGQTGTIPFFPQSHQMAVGVVAETFLAKERGQPVVLAAAEAAKLTHKLAVQAP